MGLFTHALFRGKYVPYLYISKIRRFKQTLLQQDNKTITMRITKTNVSLSWYKQYSSWVDANNNKFERARTIFSRRLLVTNSSWSLLVTELPLAGRISGFQRSGVVLLEMVIPEAFGGSEFLGWLVDVTEFAGDCFGIGWGGWCHTLTFWWGWGIVPLSTE